MSLPISLGLFELPDLFEIEGVRNYRLPVPQNGSLCFECLFQACQSPLAGLDLLVTGVEKNLQLVS